MITQQTTASMGPGCWIRFLNRSPYLEHLHSTNLYGYLWPGLVTQKHPIWSHRDHMLKGYSLQALYTPNNPTFSGLFQKPREEPPVTHDPIYYLPHMQVAFLWHITFSNTKSNISWKTKLVIKCVTTWTPPATGLQIQKLVTSLKQHSKVFKYNCCVLPEESRTKKYGKSQL